MSARSSSLLKEHILLAVKVCFYCFFVLLLQTALIGDLYLTDVQVNLVFCSLIVFASTLTLFETVVAAVFFTVASSMLLFDGDIYWFYIVGAALAAWINPAFIPDKFLISLLYTLTFTPLFELMSPSSTPYWDRTMEAVLLNVLTVIPLFVIVKLLRIRN